ncbi:COMM domain-containing protein 10 [Thrips palmi]|uniref:COMM domain-containing protein 10 n=1 Tax=Thrips palmi TaxID=161013 RepID=A0A6P8YXL7_THRPL|nr:COMM domain-containing protein 10 [Thrips palmi]
MSSSWIQVTPKFQKGVTLINSIEPAKLRLLLNRIATFMQRDSVKGISSPFTEDEESKLEKSLGLQLKDVRLVIDTASLILQQSAYHIIKPDSLKSKLIEDLKLEQERAAAVASVWESNASLIVESLRKRSVLPYQFADMTWLLNVETSSDKISKRKEPVALLELLLQSGDSDNNRKVKLEMHKPQLQKLYQNLEKIQTQLDALK